MANQFLVGQRIPKDFFLTEGAGESDIAVHAGSYHLALKDAGIEMCNIMQYSSILPEIAKEVERPASLVHGSVMECIMSVSTQTRGTRATAGIIIGSLQERVSKKHYGGLVCEHEGAYDIEQIETMLHDSLAELYENGFEEGFELKDIKKYIKSFVPTKRYGTSLVAICFLNYYVPVVE